MFYINQKKKKRKKDCVAKEKTVLKEMQRKENFQKSWKVPAC